MLLDLRCAMSFQIWTQHFKNAEPDLLYPCHTFTTEPSTRTSKVTFLRSNPSTGVECSGMVRRRMDFGVVALVRLAPPIVASRTRVCSSFFESDFIKLLKTSTLSRADPLFYLHAQHNDFPLATETTLHKISVHKRICSISQGSPPENSAFSLSVYQRSVTVCCVRQASRLPGSSQKSI